MKCLFCWFNPQNNVSGQEQNSNTVNEYVDFNSANCASVPEVTLL